MIDFLGKIDGIKIFWRFFGSKFKNKIFEGNFSRGKTFLEQFFKKEFWKKMFASNFSRKNEEENCIRATFREIIKKKNYQFLKKLTKIVIYA